MLLSDGRLVSSSLVPQISAHTRDSVDDFTLHGLFWLRSGADETLARRLVSSPTQWSDVQLSVSIDRVLTDVECI